MKSETPLTDAATHDDWSERAAAVNVEVAKQLELDNLRLHDELDRLLKIETAARQWWKAKGRHNSQIAACKLGEALGQPVTWLAGYIPANVATGSGASRKPPKKN